jgi:hypothetical protein
MSVDRSLKTGRGKKKEKKMSNQKEVLQAFLTLDAESQAKILAAAKKSVIIAALEESRKAEMKEREEREKALQANMSKIGKILDEINISGKVIFEKAEKGWGFRIGDLRKEGTKKRSPRSPRSLILDDRIRNIIEKYVKEKKIPKKDPNRCKESGACEVYIFDSQEGEVRIPASVMGFWAIENGANYDHDIQKVFPFLTGGQCRGALLRYDAALKNGQIAMKGK